MKFNQYNLLFLDTAPQPYVSVGNYMAETEEVMSVREGEVLEVLDDSNDEWWLARKVDTKEEGWVPKAYLAPKEEYAERLKDQLEENIESLPVLGIPKKIFFFS